MSSGSGPRESRMSARMRVCRSSDSVTALWTNPGTDSANVVVEKPRVALNMSTSYLNTTHGFFLASSGAMGLIVARSDYDSSEVQAIRMTEANAQNAQRAVSLGRFRFTGRDANRFKQNVGFVGAFIFSSAL
jgi:hypothetical protein